MGEPPLATEPTLELDVVAETALPEDLEPSTIEDVVRLALTAEGATGSWRIAVALVDDAHLRTLHHRFMGIDAVTDVMTFPDDGPPGGDIVVSVDRAMDQAADVGHPPADEVRFLVLHGVLHLCGWNDASEDARSAMLDRQRELLAAFDRSVAAISNPDG